jgi:hypothetical protein
MVKTKKCAIKRKAGPQPDTTYMLKLVMYFIMGTFWVRLLNVQIGPFEHFSFPLGFIIGLALASRECFQVDRKIEFAVLLVATFISFYLPVGVTF